MKKFLLTALFIVMATAGFAQQPPTMANSISHMKQHLTKTPFYASRVKYERVPPNDAVVFPRSWWEGRYKVNQWVDWHLTQPKKYTEIFPGSTIHRLFAPKNVKYVVFATTLGDPSQYNEFVCTATETGEYIDNIEGGFSFDDWSASTSTEEGCGQVFLKQYMITVDMNVVVYHIIPAANRNISAEGNPSSFTGTRVDTTYKIDKDGKFVKIKEVTYMPTTYTLNNLASRNANLWNGRELVKTTRTF